jgi:hypothetical protein
MLQLEPEVLGIKPNRTSYVLHLISNAVDALDEGVLTLLCGLDGMDHVILSFSSVA